MPPSFRCLHQGDELLAGGARWQVVVGRGHAPEHACFLSRERGLFIAGDQVLPHITPNVSVWPSEPEGEPLSELLESLEALRPIPDHVLVLPSHGSPFTGLRGRCDELADHHRQRLDAAVAACEQGPRTALEVTAALFQRELDPHQSTFAIGEAIAHLNHLVAAGRLRRARTSDAPDRYSVASRPLAPPR